MATSGKDAIEANGVAFFGEVCANDLEGIVAKRRAGPYIPEPTTWVKIKNPRYSQAVGRRDLFERRRGQWRNDAADLEGRERGNDACDARRKCIWTTKAALFEE